MKKLNEWLTLVANVAVVAGIVFLAVELRQNTQAIQAQTRDSITEKQMEFYGWVATSPRLAEAWSQAQTARLDGLEPVDRWMFDFFLQGVFREWENSHYQFQNGLFTPEEFTARVNRWRALLQNLPAARDVWRRSGDSYAGDFKAEVDRIVAEANGQAADQ